MPPAKLNPPFRADHVGSLLRPAALRQAFRDHTAGNISAEEFAAIQDDAIRDAVALQENAGLQAITDGEFRRASYWSHFVEGIDGLEVAEARFDFTDAAGHAMHFFAPHVTGPIRRTGPLSGGAFDFLKSATRSRRTTRRPNWPWWWKWRRPSGGKSAQPTWGWQRPLEPCTSARGMAWLARARTR